MAFKFDETDYTEERISQTEQIVDDLESDKRKICEELGIGRGSSMLQIIAAIRRLRGGNG